MKEFICKHIRILACRLLISLLYVIVVLCCIVVFFMSATVDNIVAVLFDYLEYAGDCCTPLNSVLATYTPAQLMHQWLTSKHIRTSLY